MRLSKLSNFTKVLVIFRHQNSNRRRLMHGHTVIGDSPQSHNIHRLQITQVKRQRKVGSIPTTPFKIGILVTSPQPISQQTKVSISRSLNGSSGSLIKANG